MGGGVVQKTKAFLVLWVTCALLIAHGRETAVVAQGGPAPGWFDADIGSVGQAGSASQSDDTFTVRGGGSDIWGTSDSFNFAYTPLAGDGDIWVLARSQTATNPFAKAGVMIRQSLDPSSPFAIFDVKPDGGLELMIRTTQGGTTTFVKGAPTSGPTFLRLSRRGAQVAAFIQTPGPTCSMGCDQWTMFSDNWIGLQDGPMLMGLAVTSHDPSTVNSAVLDFWGTQKLNAPWRQADFYPETHVDSAFTLTQPGQSDTYVLPAAGADIWGTADSFKYVWQRVDGDTTIVARVTGERYTNSFAKAGVMMRNNLTPGAQSIVLDVKPDGGIEFMARAQEDTGATQFLAGGFMPFPAWLKLERHGSLFIGSQSSDGQTWTVVGSTSIPMRTEMFAGLAATSHTSTYTPFGATFDNVSLSQPHGADLLKKGGFEVHHVLARRARMGIGHRPAGAGNCRRGRAAHRRTEWGVSDNREPGLRHLSGCHAVDYRRLRVQRVGIVGQTGRPGRRRYQRSTPGVATCQCRRIPELFDRLLWNRRPDGSRLDVFAQPTGSHCYRRRVAGERRKRTALARHMDAALVAAGVLDVNGDGLGRLQPAGELLRPFDREHAAGGNFVEPEIVDLPRIVEAVQVDVIQREPAGAGTPASA